MKHFKSYPSDFVKPLQFCFQLLNFCNINLFDEEFTPLRKYWRFVYIAPCVVLHYVSMATYALEIFSTKDVADFAFAVSFYIIVNQAIFKAILLILNKKEIKSIINELGTTWREELTPRQAELKNAYLRRLDLCQKIFYWTSITAAWVYLLLPLVEMLRGLMLGQKVELLLPYQCRYPLDPTTHWLLYVGIYVFQSYNMFFFYMAYMGSESVMIALCSHLVIEFSLLCEDLSQLNSSQSRERGDGEELGIVDIVRRHQSITVLCKQLDLIFNKSNCAILIFSTIISCLFAFAAKVAHVFVYTLIYYIAVFGVMVPLFILCYYSELLATQSMRVAESAYYSRWYKGSIQHRKYICFIIMRSQKPCCLTTMGYEPLSHKTFKQVISTTWSYLSVITRLYEERL